MQRGRSMSRNRDRAASLQDRERAEAIENCARCHYEDLASEIESERDTQQGFLLTRDKELLLAGELGQSE